MIPVPHHSLATLCLSITAFNSGDLCVLLALLSGGTGGKHPWPCGEERGDTSPRCSCPSHAGRGSLNPHRAFPARAPKCPQCVPRAPQGQGLAAAWHSSSSPAAAERLPPHLSGHQAPEAHLVPADFQEEKFMAAYKVQGGVK